MIWVWYWQETLTKLTRSPQDDCWLFTLFRKDLDMPLCHSSFLHCIYVCCVVAGYVWWSFHPVDSIIDSLLLIHYSSVYFFRLFFTSFGVAGGSPMILPCAVCCARILWNRLGFLGITCDFEFGTGKRRSLSLLGLLRMLDFTLAGNDLGMPLCHSSFLRCITLCVLCRGWICVVVIPPCW